MRGLLWPCGEQPRVHARSRTGLPALSPPCFRSAQLERRSEVSMVRGNVGWRMALCSVAVVSVLAGCATSRYDVKLEAAATEWQEQVGAFIKAAVDQAGTPGGEYEANKQFYE